MQAVSNTYHIKVADIRYRSNEQMNDMYYRNSWTDFELCT